MPLHKIHRNMYPYITHTWNPIKGECSHDCSYCYVKKMMQQFKQKQKLPKFYESELKVNLGTGKIIFVGSNIDIFSELIPFIWIINTLDHCKKYPDNLYFFQTKNPARYIEFANDNQFPEKVIFCTTIETNRYYPEIMGNSPMPLVRMKHINDMRLKKYATAITIEPILDFDFSIFSSTLIACRPNFIYIGMDSKKCGLPEPGKNKIKELIDVLRKSGLNVRIKDNLWRLIK